MRRSLPEVVQQKLDLLPTEPGCYLMKNADGKIIYVGKAINLRNRVRSYFQDSANHPVRTRRLVAEIADLEWIIRATELEALVLENDLIKTYQPRYNVRLKDDKQYPYIRINVQDAFPKVESVRRMVQDGAQYYGPFTSRNTVEQTLEVLRRIFPYLDCNRVITGNDAKPCLYYHIKRCVGPCIGAVNQEEYRQVINGLAHFLEGDTEAVMKNLNERMTGAAEAWQFERAAMYRDQIKAAERIVSQQRVVTGQEMDEDVVAFARDGQHGEACVQIFFVRRGRLIGRESFILAEAGEEDASPEEMMSSFLKQFYNDAAHVPEHILLPRDLDERVIIEQWLRSKRGAEVHLRVPTNGGRELVQMAADNAAETLRVLRAQYAADTNKQTQGISELQEALNLPRPPSRIECYDISTLQGTNSVGAMVVFAKGAPLKSDYRKFKIRTVGSVGEPNDFASMREMLRRRFRRAVEKNEDVASEPGEKARTKDQNWKVLPDLVVIDGGKGQLGIAIEVLAEYELTEVVPVIGLAKQREEVFLPGRSDSIMLPRGSQGLFLLQNIRDEAHRYGITFHRSLRGKEALVSALDEVPGIGPKRRTALLKHFGSVDAIRKASVEELTAVKGITDDVAKQVKSHL